MMRAHGLCLLALCGAAGCLRPTGDKAPGLYVQVSASTFHLQPTPGGGAVVSVPFTVQNNIGYTLILPGCDAHASPVVERQSGATWSVYMGGVCDGDETPISLGVSETTSSTVTLSDTGTYRLVVSDSGYETPPTVAMSGTFKVLAPAP